MFFTTHSAIETYKTCPRKRYLNYHHLGTGIVPSSNSIPLTTGSEVHLGIGYILDKYRNGAAILASTVDAAIRFALAHYQDKVSNSPTFIENNGIPEADLYTFKEQCALIQALILTWYYIEFPNIVQYYKVLEVEKEIPYPLTDDTVILGSKADAILKHKETGDVVVYSIKTMKRWDKRSTRSYKKGTQVVTESEAVKYFLSMQQSHILKLLTSLREYKSYIPNGDKLEKYLEEEVAKSECKSVGIKFCFLVKGDRRSFKQAENGEVEQDNEQWYTPSPLITGYKKYTANGIEYAYSNKTVKPENKSGFGRLGKGWEEFNVWEEESLGKEENDRISQWIVNLYSSRLQPELERLEGNILKQQIITPPEIYPKQERINETLISLESQELNIGGWLQGIEISNNTIYSIDNTFPKNDRACHWPINCEYLPICWGERVYSDTPFHVPLESVLESGVYQRREPHYKLEEEYNIKTTIEEMTELDILQVSQEIEKEPS